MSDTIRGPSRFVLKDLVEVAVRTSFMAFPIAVTEEVWVRNEPATDGSVRSRLDSCLCPAQSRAALVAFPASFAATVVDNFGAQSGSSDENAVIALGRTIELTLWGSL